MWRLVHPKPPKAPTGADTKRSTGLRGLLALTLLAAFAPLNVGCGTTVTASGFCAPSDPTQRLVSRIRVSFATYQGKPQPTWGRRSVEVAAKYDDADKSLHFPPGAKVEDFYPLSKLEVSNVPFPVLPDGTPRTGLKVEYLDDKGNVLKTIELADAQQLKTQPDGSLNILPDLLTDFAGPCSSDQRMSTTFDSLHAPTVSNADGKTLITATYDPQTLIFDIAAFLGSDAPAVGPVVPPSISAWWIDDDNYRQKYRFIAVNGQSVDASSVLENTKVGTPSTVTFAFSGLPDALFTGNECRGHLAWTFDYDKGHKTVTLTSPDFVAATRKAPDTPPAPTTTSDVMQMKVVVAESNPGNNVVKLRATYEDSAQALYKQLRAAVGKPTDGASTPGYDQMEQEWTQAGGDVSTAFQPGQVIGQTLKAVGAAETNLLAITLPSEWQVSLSWPTKAVFDLFKGADGVQSPVTGYLVRTYRFQGQTIATLTSNQVTWGTAPRPVSHNRGGGATVPPSPTIASVTPNSGVVGSNVTITGTNFRPGATVTVGGLSATVLAVVSGTSITVTVPASLAVGAHDVVVTNSDATSVTAAGAFVVPAAPTLTGVAPNNGPVGTTVTLMGTNFRAGATVTIGGVSATGVNVVSGTSITATVPAGLAAAAQNVVVTNTDTTSVTSVGGFTVTAAPGGSVTLALETPIGGIAPAGSPFSLTGTNFQAGATVTIGGVAAVVTVDSSTHISGTIPSGVTHGFPLDVVVTNTDTTSGTLPGALFVP